jgi:hypothetical protein
MLIQHDNSQSGSILTTRKQEESYKQLKGHHKKDLSQPNIPYPNTDMYEFTLPKKETNVGMRRSIGQYN